ncbi:MAG: protein kinase, partial [Anaerolineales bacterium]
MAIIHPNLQTIRGYELRERIGAGGFGVVYRAYQSAVDREVAIKVILPEYANHPDFIRSFESEARLIARLEHLHIVPLYDYWREPDGAYLVMRWLTGGNLRQSLQESPWEPQRASHMLDQITSALALAHSRGVVHRDLKPENILLDEAGNAYLSDFGVAKDLFQSTQLTETGVLKGSFAFISPEQVQGEPISPQSDLYSLGIVMFEVLTGQHPFEGETPTAQLFKHVSEPVPSIHELRPDLPEGLDEVIQTVTAKQPAKRYPDALAFAAAFRAALHGARIEIPTPETLLVTAEPVNPYKGLRAFEEVDAADFFGREATVEALLARMSEEGDDTRFLAVVGPSGSGKSSLVKAGLIPALGRGELPASENWFVVDMLPGSHPLDELEVALTRVAAEQGANLSEHLHRDERGLLRTAGLILPDDGSELVVIVDQFEETFTLVEDEARRKQFLDLLHAAVRDPRSRVRVVVTLRADFYDRPLQYPGIAELVQGRTETVLPLSAEELERAIVKPAERVGVRYEQGLVASIVGEVHYQPGALPLLQYALTELFEERDGRLLTHEAYEGIGRAVGALASRAEATYAELDEAGQEAVKQMFLRLVTLGEGVEDTRRRVERAELLAVAADPELMNQVIDTFAAYRLLSLDHDPATRRPTVEVAHEALLREWDRLREWLDESRADIRLQRQLARAAKEWSDADRDSSFLLRGARLEQFETWSRITELALTQLEEDYLKVSLDAESKRLQREAQQERLRRNLQRALIAVLSVGLIVAVGLSIFAFGQQRIANQRREEAQVQAAILLAAQAESKLREGYSDRAVLLALVALENYPYTPQAEHALGQAVSYNRSLQGHMGHTGAVTSAAWSPDGTRVATSSTDNSVHVWDAASGEELLVIDLPEGITGNIYDYALTVKWSPDGEHLLTLSGDRFLLGSQDYDLMLWEATPGNVADPLMAIELSNQAEPEEGEGSVTTFGVHYVTGAAADFAPQSGRLATLGGDDTAIIWDADLQEELVLRGHENDVNSVD